jgi:predicted  nucleic acid-binding Zn-ribbon protein
MANNFCPSCGHDLRDAVADVEHAEQDEHQDAVAEEAVSAEVRIAEIQATRDVQLAKINAGMLRDEVAVESAVDAAHAQGEAAGLREALTPPAPVVEEAPAPEAMPAPIVISDDHSGPDVPPPPPAEHDAPPSKPKRRGFWG